MAKILEARVKQDFWMPSVRAFSGMEFVKSEWRLVPPEFTEAARKNEMLEVREAKAPAVVKESAPPPVEAPKEEPKFEYTTRRRKIRKDEDEEA